jgi:hypothetical protein
MTKVKEEIKTPKDAWRKVSRLRKIRRLPELEPLILQDANCSYNYALKIIRARWPEAEPIILEKGTPKTLHYYAKNIIKDRWVEAEPKILASKSSSFDYANDVIRGRWPEAEKIILEKGAEEIKDKYHFWDSVLMTVVKNRWPEAEEIMATNPCALKEYAIEVLQDKLPDHLHNMMIGYSIGLDKEDRQQDIIKQYFEYVKSCENLLKKQLINRNLGDITVKDFIETL